MNKCEEVVNMSGTSCIQVVNKLKISHEQVWASHEQVINNSFEQVINKFEQVMNKAGISHEQAWAEKCQAQ